MPANTGNSRLKRKARAASPMRDYDNLPYELRVWMAQAILPWSAASVHTSYRKAVARTGSNALAVKELDHLQRALVAKDAAKIWGDGHPFSNA